MPDEKIWKIDPHTKAKHLILERYLKAWIPILSNKNERMVILDGFAGPGEYSEGEHGSPIIAIDTLLAHSAKLIDQVEFIFIENDRDRRNHLEQLLQQRYNVPVNWKIFAGTFVEKLPDVLQYIDSNRIFADVPTFAFIDPFGFSHTPMQTLAELMRRPKFEVLITFMQEFVNRFIDVEYTNKSRQFDDLFGIANWRNLVAGAANPAEREQRIHNLYRDQLHNAAKIRYVRSFGMQSERGSTVYYLFFGTNHPLGLKKMKEAMWVVDPSGGYYFSDRTDPNQLVLFYSPDFDILQRQLQQHFSGKSVPIEEVEYYVNTETPFIHFKKEGLRPMEMANPSKIHIVSSKHKRKRGTYPDGTVLHFA